MKTEERQVRLQPFVVLLTKATCGGRCPYKINPTAAGVTIKAPCSTHRLSLATPLACWCLPPDSKLGVISFTVDRPLFPRAWSCRDSGGKRTQVIRLGARTRVPLNPAGCCPALAARWYPCASQYSSVGLPGTPGETGLLRRQVSQEHYLPTCSATHHYCDSTDLREWLFPPSPHPHHRHV